jgi:hypothetical protein
MPLISVTRLHIRSTRYLPMFFVQAIRSARQAARWNGNIAVWVMRQDNRTFWTQTVWDNQESMKAFMIGGAHGKVMRKLLHWCDEAAVVHWDQEGPGLPTWDQSYEHLREGGRRSKVNFPSPAHSAFTIPRPPSHPKGQMQFR